MQETLNFENGVGNMEPMKFMSLREIRSETGRIKEMPSDSKIVITNKSKPIAFIISVDETSFEATLSDLQKLQGMRAMRSLQRQAQKNGLSEMTLDDINVEIVEARKESQMQLDRAGVI
jgi:PHD/YefM family antitoxin component YafN of YafNO toxin-antitoxin module